MNENVAPWLFDGHIHCRPFTKSAFSGVKQTIKRAKDKGLSGISILAKDAIESKRSYEDMLDMFGDLGVKLFPGSEISTTHGPVLVYGVLIDVDLTFDQNVEICSLVDFS
ncbi:hypothetical protein LCGC14_1614860, partial [marine sediment metagenome]